MPDSPLLKPGYQTTEFWQTLLVDIVAIMTLFGVHIPNSDATINALATIAALLASALVTHSYTRGRSMLKATALSQATH